VDLPSGDLADFAALRARIVGQAHRWGRVEALAGGGVLVTRKRARVAVIDGTREHPPDRYDVLCVVAPTPALGDALQRISSPRVQVLPLPASPGLADRCLHEALLAADAYDQARTADRLLEIGVALNAERDPLRVLQLILAHAREITHADAGSIYLVEGDGDDGRLSFKFADNDSMHTDLSEFTVPITASSIVGSTVLTGRTVRVDDLYAAFDPQKTMPPWSHDKSFDQRTGYQTRSMITSPMVTPDGRVLAVIQLINARKDDAGPLRTPADFALRVEPFTGEDERLCSALGAQGAVALDNARLYAEIQALFEGFVRASVLAIEQRDPTTSGHSQRVADLTVALATAADRADSGPFAHVTYTREQLREIEYAGLLHDFGKVGVREEVLVKAKKLYPHQLELVLERFEHMRTVLQVRLLEAQLGRARAGVHDDDVQAWYRAEIARLDDAVQAVLVANEPSVLPKEVGVQLERIAALSVPDVRGRPIRPIGERELLALTVQRGTLTESERIEIQQHVTHTYNFLVRIPWGRTLAGVPDIAAKHHEYLDGTGYPARLPAPEIPLQARMMTVADIFDALTAADRPYKRAVPIPHALDILRSEVRVGRVDAHVLDLFVQAKVHDALGVPRT